MSTGYMGTTSICREFVTTKKAGGDCTDSNISCSICTIVLSDECDTVLVVNSTNSTLQCIECYSKTSGITTNATTKPHLHSSTSSIPVTPSAPRARNTSDVSEIGCGEDAANAAASFSALMDQQQKETAAPLLQASPAMLTCDGMYLHSKF